MWANVRAQIEAQFIRVPLWYEPVCAAPPLPQFLLPHKDIPKLDLPEARLYTKLVRKFPHLATVTRMHDSSSKVVSVADRLVRRQLSMVRGCAGVRLLVGVVAARWFRAIVDDCAP